jgi:hypothetical protein
VAGPSPGFGILPFFIALAAVTVKEDGRIDVAEVMAGIRERIRGKRERGLYTDDEVEELTALKLQAFSDEAEIDPELLARLMAPNHNWNISVDYRIKTHRRGFSARLIVLAKTFVRPIVRLYTDHVLNRQAQLNLYMVYLCHNLVRELVRLQLDHTALRNRYERLEAERPRNTGGPAGA